MSTRRSIIGAIMGTPIGNKFAEPKRVMNPPSIVEGNMDPLPSFPMLAIIAVNDIRVIKLITSRSYLATFDPDITDSEIKDLVYRNYTGYTTYEDINRPYKLTTATKLKTNTDGTVTWEIWLVSKGDFLTVTF